MYPLDSTYGHINTTKALRLYSNNGTLGVELNNGTLGLNNLNVTASQINSRNLTISGTLQNPNHIGVSNIAYNDVSFGEKLIL